MAEVCEVARPEICKADAPRWELRWQTRCEWGLTPRLVAIMLMVLLRIRNTVMKAVDDLPGTHQRSPAEVGSTPDTCPIVFTDVWIGVGRLTRLLKILAHI
jgi:hypothetical protein